VAREQQINGGIPRWADAGIALVGLVVLSPLIALSALAIVITSGWPVFFRQKRVGRGGQTFTLVKFRTMTTSNDGPEVTRKGDRRVTRLGKFLRHTKLDELPTLWNIVRGDMALVGPRPEVPRYVKLDDPKWLTILKVRPGITDPVTLQLRNEEVLLAGIDGDLESYYVNELQPAKLRGYLDYLQNRSARSDLRLLCQTLVEVLRNRR
jgi:lipopolysaccharide/colanic/teichoic acid biosynthesis glycosyltransferase